MNWAIQDAKNRFSQLVQLARNEGPQTVTVRGERAVLSAQDHDASRADRPSLVDHILSGPAWDDNLVETVNARSKAPGREVDL